MNNVIHINVLDTLPCEEEMDYLQKAKNGDRKSREKVILHKMGLVTYRIRDRFNYLPYDKDELFLVGAEGLIKAVDTYEFREGATFTTYARFCIDREILNFLEKERRVLNNEILSDEERCYKPSFATALEKQEMIGHIREVLQSMPDQEREIIKLYFGFYDDKKYKQCEIAKMLNKDQGNFSRDIRKILEEMKRRLIVNYYPEEASFALKEQRNKKYSLSSESEKTKKIGVRKPVTSKC